MKQGLIFAGILLGFGMIGLALILGDALAAGLVSAGASIFAGIVGGVTGGLIAARLLRMVPEADENLGVDVARLFRDSRRR